MAVQTTLQLVATLCAGLFAGASIYINVVEHPARMSLGTEAAARQWAPSYQRATWMQAPLALVGSLCAVIAWFIGATDAWLIGGICLGLVVPYTLLIILPTNHRLEAAELDKKSDEARILLIRWGRLHAVRSVLSLAALLLLLVAD